MFSKDDKVQIGYKEIGTVVKYNKDTHLVAVKLTNGKVFIYDDNSLKLIKKGKGEEDMELKGNFKIAIVNFIQGYNTKDYEFALYDEDVKVGDMVVCDTTQGYNIAKVKNIIEQDDYCGFVTKEIVCKCDFKPFENRKKNRERKAELKKKLDKAVQENQNLMIYKALAKDNESIASLLKEYEELDNI